MKAIKRLILAPLPLQLLRAVIVGVLGILWDDGSWVVREISLSGRALLVSLISINIAAFVFTMFRTRTARFILIAYVLGFFGAMWIIVDTQMLKSSWWAFLLIFPFIQMFLPGLMAFWLLKSGGAKEYFSSGSVVLK